MEPYWQETEDWHTAGEPFRIVRHLPASYSGHDLPVAAQRQLILRTPTHPLNLLRQVLVHEPRGHADMYGGFIVPPDDAGAHFGVLFWHREGFSTACGHGTIALGHWAIAHGIVGDVPPGAESIDVVIDVPSGRVVARTQLDRNRAVTGVDFVSVPSYQIGHAVGMDIAVSGEAQKRRVSVVLAFGGAVYACVDVGQLGEGWAIEPRLLPRFVDLQRKIKAELKGFVHGENYEVYGVCFYQDVVGRGTPSDGVVTQKNVVVFADGQIDRSPCGSGTAARAAVLLAQGRLSERNKLVHRSILDTVFEASVLPWRDSPTDFPACVPTIRGTAHLVGRMQFYVDPSDPIYPGFLFQ